MNQHQRAEISKLIMHLRLLDILSDATAVQAAAANVASDLKLVLSIEDAKFNLRPANLKHHHQQDYEEVKYNLEVAIAALDEVAKSEPAQWVKLIHEAESAMGKLIAKPS